MLCNATPRVSEANGEIRATADPCRAMLSVAATSHRQCQVTRRIQRLHEMDARVMTMRAVKAIAVLVSSSYYRGGASWRGRHSASFVGCAVFTRPLAEACAAEWPP